MSTILLIIATFLQGAIPQRTPVGTISGRLLNAGGGPAAHIRVGATQAPEAGTTRTIDDWISLTETDADGRYVLENLPPGEYLVTTGLVSAPYYYPGVVTRSEAKVIPVKANVKVADIDFRLKGVNVRGRIIPSPTQIEFAIPELSLKVNGIMVQKTTLRSDHGFTFLNVVPGPYTVMSTGGAETDLLVPDSDVSNLEIVMPAVVQFSGRVKMERGDPPAGVEVSFKGVRTYTLPASNTRGTFGMLLPVGEYSASVPGLKDYALKAIEMDGVSLASTNFKLTEEHARRLGSNELNMVLILGPVGR